jgi:putative hemolysin
VAFFLTYAPWLIAMGMLALGSAFFSGSEAALFYLSRQDRQEMGGGTRAERLAVKLLENPDRLLTAVLFWNLGINITYFTLASITGLTMQRDGHAAEAGVFSAVTLFLLILAGEMIPKMLAVLRAKTAAAMVSLPLAVLVRVLDPVLPVFRIANLLSQRLLWPNFEPEPYLQVSDLERAVDFSTSDPTLVGQEHAVLQGLVSLSAIRVDELMRPRSRIRVFHPPISLADLDGWLPESGYLLVSEPQSDEVASAVRLLGLPHLPDEGLEHLAMPVAYVPWSTTAATALEVLQRGRRQVAAVINEFGETIGIVTLDDLLDTIFNPAASRSERLLKRTPIRQVSPGVWHVTGMTSVRRLVRHFDADRLESKSVTVAGVIQEVLERFPQPGDECRWGAFRFKVLEAPDTGRLLVELTLASDDEAEKPA